MSSHLTLALAQLNLTVGAIEANTQAMLAAATEAEQQGAELVLFPELAITGYPPEDLLFRDDLYLRVDAALEQLAAASGNTALVVGHPWRESGKLYNTASFFYQGKLQGRYFKQLLPNYGVFDEKRYFSAGEQSCVVEFKGHKLGLLICEDVWEVGPAAASKAAGAELLLSLNASPYHRGKAWIRKDLLAQRSRDNALPLVYLNQVGGQDELVFDGASFVLNADRSLACQMAEFEEGLLLTEWNRTAAGPIRATSAGCRSA